MALVALSFVFGTNAAADPNLALMDWSVSAPHSLATEPPPQKTVEEFLQLGDGVSLCSFAFADLGHNGTLSLLYGSDSSGRGFCNEIEIVDRTRSGFEVSNIDSSEPIGEGIDVSKLIRDLNRNGRLELVVTMLIGGWQGRVYCGLNWPVVFAWTGTGYADVSRQFKWFYQQRLATLQDQLNQLPPTPVPEQVETFESQPMNGGGIHVQARLIRRRPVPTLARPINASDIDCIKANAAKTGRFLRVSSDAGMDDAIRWSDSEDRLEREFAATVFEDIGTPEALDHLKTLAADSDPSVAAAPKNDLRVRAANGPPATTYGVDTIRCQLKAGSLSCDSSAP